MSLIFHSSVIYENNQSSQTHTHTQKKNRTEKISLHWNNKYKSGRNWLLSAMEWLIPLDRWWGSAGTFQLSDSRIIAI